MNRRRFLSASVTAAASAPLLVRGATAALAAQTKRLPHEVPWAEAVVVRDRTREHL